MKFVLILFVLCIDLILGATNYDGPYWNTPIQMCGPRIGVEMAIICRGRYNEDRGSKPKPSQMKIKRAIVDECCSNMCTRKFLHINYCGPEPERMSPTTSKPEELAYVNYDSYYYDLVWTVLRYPQPVD